MLCSHSLRIQLCQGFYILRAHANGGFDTSGTDVAGCIVHRDLPVGAPGAEVKINGRPFPTLLDSGSAVSLIQPCVLAPCGETKASLPIVCVHGETRHVPVRRVTISAAPAAWPVEVGVLKDLQVPVLLGRDWPGFDHLRVVEGKETQPGPDPLPHFIIRNGLLYCVAQRRGEEKTLLVVPRTKTETVLDSSDITTKLPNHESSNLETEWWSLSPTPPVSSWPADRARIPSPRRSVPSPTGSASRGGRPAGGQTSYITSTCWRNGWGQGASSPHSPLWTQWLWTSDYSCRRFRKPSCSTWSVSSQMCSSLRPPGRLRSSTTRYARHQEPL